MNRRYWIIPLALSVALGACRDVLVEEPESFVTTETFYRNPAEIDAAARSMYGANYFDWEGFRILHNWITELPSDQARINPDEPNYSTSHPDFLGWAPGDPSVNAPWRTHYRTLLRANLVLEHAPKVEFGDEEQRETLMAEAKFIRAFSYFWLTRFYGDVPLLLTPADHENQAVARTPEADVFAQIYQDLQEAAPALPPTRSGGEIGRATRGAALTLLADAYLWRKEYQNAYNTAKQVMALNVYSLNPDYIRTFLPQSKNSPEEIFSIQATGVDARTSSEFASSYFPRELGFNQGGGWGVVQPTLWHYNSYVPGDYRREVTYRLEGCSVNEKIGCIELTYPHVYKYRPSNGGVPQGRGDVNIILYRYAEVLLIAAEAANELGNTGEAAQLVNQVRARARNGNGAGAARLQPADIAPMGQDQMREAIYMERNWELAHEMKRWFDLVRRGPEYMMAQLMAHDPNAASSGNVQPFRARFPIPGPEIDRNPALTQNPGY